MGFQMPAECGFFLGYIRLYTCIMEHHYQHTHTHTHFPGQPGLAGCPFDYQSPFILILTIITGQAKTPTWYIGLYPVN